MSHLFQMAIYINILIGILDNSQKTYLVEIIATKDSVDNILITQILNNTMYSININKHYFILLISDAARYMTKATQTLKYYSSRYYTLYAHFIYCIIVHWKSNLLPINWQTYFFSQVSDREEKYQKRAFSGNLLFTYSHYHRMRYLVGGCLLLLKKFPRNTEIVRSMKGNGILLRNCRIAVKQESMIDNILCVTRCYGNLFQKYIDLKISI